MPVSRRRFTQLALAAGGAACVRVAGAAYESVLGDDGIHRQPWFMDTFLDLREDLAEAAGAGKRFVVLWEQKGCPYCRELHRVNLATPTINDFVRGHFGVVQLDLWGAREVTDFDGEVLEERRLARKWRVNFTPTLQFFPTLQDLPGQGDGAALEVVRMPGYFRRFHFLTMFEFVREKAYQRTDFQRYLVDKLARFEAEGKDPGVW